MDNIDQPRRNALAGEPSPFLQHGATQPVHWLPWGEAAFERARREDRPVLLDSGAVWCHWCHVMDRESYEDNEVAALINELYVPIKLDRDERPDVDARYQRAVQLLTGQGGWPLTAFLTPDGEVFYGGTYFPPTDGMGRPAFTRVLREVARVWREERPRALDAARGIEERLTTYGESEAQAGPLTAALLESTADELARSFDFRFGGFGDAPKFPNAGALDVLIDEWLDGGPPWTRRMFEETLLAMSRGGIYDQLGGGFHRYATDARWVIPHFEKMAYDNGPLLATYARAWAATGEPRFRWVCDGIIDHYFALAPDLLAAGGFPASQDADVGPDDDGDYWTWTRSEVLAALGGDERRTTVAVRHWGLEEARGSMHFDPERHVLFEAMSPAQVADALGMAAADVAAEIAAAREQLLAARATRPQPYVDRTQYSGWVALLASGFLTAARYLARSDAAAAGLRAVDRLLADTRPDRSVPHRVGDPESGELLEDQAFLVQALLDAFELTQQEHYLGQARTQAEVLQQRFADPLTAGLRDRPPGTDVVARPLARAHLPISDSPTPSGNGTAALSLLRLAELTGDDATRARGVALLEAFAGSAERLGSGAATFVRAAGWVVRDPCQVVIVGRAEEGRELLETALRCYRPRLTVRWLDAGNVRRARLPSHLAAMIDATSPRAYVCIGRSCLAPVATAAELRAQLQPPPRE